MLQDDHRRIDGTRMFKHVVVGSDGSPEGSDAVVLGAEIAAATGAGLHLVQTLGSTSHTRALIHFSQRVHADLIVVGSSPKAPAGRCAIGRHARQLLHDAPHALAIAKRGLHALAGGLHSMGVGYDGGPESVAAVELATELSHSAGAELRVLTVVEQGVPALTWANWMASDWENLCERLHEQALARAK